MKTQSMIQVLYSQKSINDMISSDLTLISDIIINNKTFKVQFYRLDNEHFALDLFIEYKID